MIEQLNALRQSVYEGNKSRGFWEPEEINKGERVMLIITELAEAVEAHRKGKQYINNPVSLAFLDGSIVSENPVLLWVSEFKEAVKDTVEDEIADAVIRILDYTGGFDIPIIERDYRKVSTGNFAHDILRITYYCIDVLYCENGMFEYSVRDWGYVLASIIKFCEWYKIDLMQHVQWKLKYNSTRSYKHGKKY